MSFYIKQNRAYTEKQTHTVNIRSLVILLSEYVISKFHNQRINNKRIDNSPHR